MSQKANPAMIGLFVAGAVFLAVVSILFFGSTHIFTSTQRFVVFFEESVNGLDIGAPVKFKGVPVGEVTGILLSFDTHERTAEVPVILTIDESRLHESLGFPKGSGFVDVFKTAIKHGLRAKLQYQSFVTGMLFLDLDYYPDAPPAVEEVSNFTGYPVIPSISSGLGGLWKSAGSAFAQISQIDFGTIGSEFKKLLIKLNKGFDDLDLKEINDNLVRTLKDIDKFFDLPELTESVQKLQSLLTKLDSGADPFLDDFHKTLAETRSTLKTLEEGFSRFSEMLDPDAAFRQEFSDSLRAFKQASESVKALADTLDENPSAIITGKN